MASAPRNSAIGRGRARRKLEGLRHPAANPVFVGWVEERNPPLPARYEPRKLSWSSFDDPRSLIPGPSPGGRRGKSPSPIGRGVGVRGSPVVIGDAVDSAASTAVSRIIVRLPA